MPTVNFEIRVADFSKEHFALSVIAAPKLSPELARKSFPIPKRDLERIAGPDLSLAVSSKDQVLRAPGSSANLDVQAFGEQLFRILIWDHQDRELIASWEHFAEQAEHARCLRLCLANQVPALPWEALRDPYKLNGSLSAASSQSCATFQPLRPSSLWTSVQNRSECSSCLPIRTATWQEHLRSSESGRPSRKPWAAPQRVGS